MSESSTTNSIAEVKNLSAAPFIQNCSIAVRCNEDWFAMKEVEEGVRWCRRCEEAVYRVVTIGELAKQVAKGHCVCVIDSADSKDAGSSPARPERVALLGQVVQGNTGVRISEVQKKR